MSTDDRTETITDRAAIRDSDEPSERGDFPCCTTPPPVSTNGRTDMKDAERESARAVWADAAKAVGLAFVMSAHWCGSMLTPGAGYPCSCWQADLRAALATTGEGQ
jgi:hypothetical protein